MEFYERMKCFFDEKSYSNIVSEDKVQTNPSHLEHSLVIDCNTLYVLYGMR